MSCLVVVDPTVPNRAVPRDPPFPSARSPLEPTPVPVASRGRTRAHDQHRQTMRRFHVLRGERLRGRRRRPHCTNENNSSIVALLLWLSSLWGAVSRGYLIPDCASIYPANYQERTFGLRLPLLGAKRTCLTVFGHFRLRPATDLSIEAADFRYQARLCENVSV